MAQTRLKQLREEAVLTVHELAEASGVSDDTISKIENGQRVARPSTLRKLAHALDVSPQELRRPARVEQSVLAGKADAPIMGRSTKERQSPLSAEQALAIADSDHFRRAVKDAPTAELQQTALELASFTQRQTRENPSTPKEAHQRTLAHERIGIISGELDLRGARSPVELVVRQFNNATTPPEEIPHLTPEAQENQEAG